METNWGRTIGQGLIAGVLGFVVVAAVCAIADLSSGRPLFYTAALLGSALFGEVPDPATLSVSLSPVLAYSAVHLAAFLVFGTIASALATVADRGMQLWFVALFFFIFISFHLFGAVQSLAIPVRSVLPGAMIWTAGFAASIVMGAYLLRAHPRMRSAQPW